LRMLGSFRLSSSIFVFVLATTAAIACGSDDSSTFDGGDDAQGDATTDVSNGPETGFGFDTGAQDGNNDATLQGFDVQPSTLQTITVPLGQTTPTVQFTATYNGQPVGAGWIVDRGNLASVGAGP